MVAILARSQYSKYMLDIVIAYTRPSYLIGILLLIVQYSLAYWYHGFMKQW